LTPEILLVLGILLASVVLFAWERFSPDVIALLVLMTLAVTGLVTTDELFTGFSSPAVVTVWAVYIISDGLFKTGIADFLGAQILNLAGQDERRLIAVVMLIAGLLSAFMNNVGATAVLLPAVVNVCHKLGLSPSKLLIPLSFSSLMGGNLTLIGTPPNILASGILQEYENLQSFEFFDFTPMGLVILSSGILYMVFIGRHLLPATKQNTELTQNYRLRHYTTEVYIPSGSSLIGKTISESRLGTDYDLTILSKVESQIDNALPAYLASQQRWSLNPHERIRVNDVFLVQGRLEKILQLRELKAVKLRGEVQLSDATLRVGDEQIVEAIIPPNCPLIDTTLREIRFREKYHLNVLALWRDGHPIRQELAHIQLHLGDVLLLHGHKDDIDLIRRDAGGLIVLGAIQHERRRTNKAPIALVIMAFMLTTVTTGVLHISVAAVMASVAMVMTNILSMDEAYRAIQWRAVFLIAGMLPLGIAMENTGTAAFLAQQIINASASLGLGAMGVMMGIYIITVLVTQPMSNAAATVLFVPIAIDAARTIGANPQAFVMAVVIAASTAFLTPIGHQSNVLVYGVGGYKFTDFTKVGLGLNLLYLILVILVLPIFWPLY
jgi:di/tricarboxylate transporter